MLDAHHIERLGESISSFLRVLLGIKGVMRRRGLAV